LSSEQESKPVASSPTIPNPPKQVGLLIAGAKERGELESRVTKLIQETREADNVVLM
jgi:hypothetical protein